jgi:hypothetical protein
MSMKFHRSFQSFAFYIPYLFFTHMGPAQIRAKFAPLSKRPRILCFKSCFVIVFGKKSNFLSFIFLVDCRFWK